MVAPHQRGIEAGEFGDPRAAPGDRRRVAFTARQVEQELGRGVVFDVRETGARHRPLLGTRGGCHRGQARHIVERVERGTVAAKVERRRYHHQAGDAGSLVGSEFTGQPRHPEAAIAFAQQVFRRNIAVEPVEPAADRLGEIVDVAFDRPEPAPRIGIAREHARIAGACRVDEHQIGEVEPGLGIRHRLGRRRWRGGVATDRNAPWSDRADIQPGGREARPAIEHERHRATGFLGVLQLERDEGKFGARRVLLVGEEDGAGGRLEVQGAAGKLERVVGGRRPGKPRRFGRRVVRSRGGR